MLSRKTLVLAATAAGVAGLAADAQRRSAADALAEPFVGVTTNGDVEAGLFDISATGVSTAPVVSAARTFLDSLGAEQREATAFETDSIEWRDWHNVHRYQRKGVARWQMSAERTSFAPVSARADSPTPATSCGSTRRFAN